MHQEQRVQTTAMLSAQGIETAVFAHPHSITWLTGFTPPLQTGPNPFAGAPPLVVYAEGKFSLVVVDAWAAAAAACADDDDAEVLTYLGYTIEKPIDGPGELHKLLRTRWPGRLVGDRFGAELDAVPAAVLDALQAPGGRDAASAIDGWLLTARMVKTAEEVALLRKIFRLSDVGHAAARQAAQAGASEIEVWTALEGAIQRSAGERVPVGNDCVVGYREDNIGGWPKDLRLRTGDSLIVDISTIWQGYWSDSCATYFAGAPSSKQRAIYQVVTDAQAYGASLLRPGAVCGEIDRALRQFIARAGYPVYPHHSGHGVGVSGHEGPRLVPYSQEVLVPGMIVMLEPGIYFPGETGVRLEDGYLITVDGCEVLTKHDKQL